MVDYHGCDFFPERCDHIHTLSDVISRRPMLQAVTYVCDGLQVVRSSDSVANRQFTAV